MSIEIPSTLVGLEPAAVLQHGPSKRYVDRFLWFDDKLGTIAEYTPTTDNVKDHFGVFRGVDQIEAFAQGTAVATMGLLEWMKQKRTLADMLSSWNMAFLGVGKVVFHHFLREGQTFICIGQIQFYRFRQLVVSGRIYKVPVGLDLAKYFSQYRSEDFMAYHLDEGFQLVAEISEVTGRMIRAEQFGTSHQ